MFLEGFIGAELDRIRTDHYRRINPLIASHLTGGQSARYETVRSRVGATLIRAGARMAGAGVDDCLKDVLDPRPAQAYSPTSRDPGHHAVM